MSDTSVLRFLDSVAGHFARSLALFTEDVATGFEIIFVGMVNRLSSICHLCGFASWRWQKCHCLDSLSAPDRYPQYLYEEVWGCEGYDVAWPA